MLSRVVALVSKMLAKHRPYLAQSTGRTLVQIYHQEIGTILPGRGLVRRETVNPELAEEITEKLQGKSQNVRDTILLARLTPQFGIEKAPRLLLA